MSGVTLSDVGRIGGAAPVTLVVSVAVTVTSGAQTALELPEVHARSLGQHPPPSEAAHV